MPPAVIALLILTGLFALLPTRRLALRTEDRWLVAAYYVAFWILLIGAIALPPVRRIAIPIVIVMAIIPWVTLRTGLGRLFGRPDREERPPPRNVTPPDGNPPDER